MDYNTVELAEKGMAMSSENEDLYQEADPAADFESSAPFAEPTAYVNSLRDQLFSDLTTDDVSYITGLDKSTVLKYVKDGTIEGYLLGRSWRIPAESLRKFKEYLITEARRVAQELRLERECEQRQQAEPDNGWALARCPRTGSLMLVQDETDLDVEAFQALGAQELVKTGRKTGVCDECSYPDTVWGGSDLVPVSHTFGSRTLPEQAEPIAERKRIVQHLTENETAVLRATALATKQRNQELIEHDNIQQRAKSLGVKEDDFGNTVQSLEEKELIEVRGQPPAIFLTLTQAGRNALHK